MTNPEEIEEFIRQKLPSLLRQRSDFRYEILGIMADVFASKDDLKMVLKELEKLREDSNRRFEASERRFEALLKEIRQFREETNQRFEAMERRFEARFEAMDRRFEAVDRRFEAMERRFEARFEAVDRRFEAVDRRFEAMDRRFEAIASDLKDLRLEVSALSGRLGRGVEEIVRQTVEKFSGQRFKEVQRLVIKDELGELYGVPAEVEYDLYLGDTVNYVVEVKSHAKSSDVLNFYRKMLFAEKKLGKTVKGLLITASTDKVARKKCRELGLDLITRSVV